MFHFKQFSIDQQDCAMKINTDGVLLGAIAEADNPLNIIDVGTGTGVIALMLAQRFQNSVVDAIEIEKSAAVTAKSNFSNSHFSKRIKLYHISFKTFFKTYPDKKYDLIVTNPPFYINSLQSPEANKRIAKHANEDFFRGLINSASLQLNQTGLLWMILPIHTAHLVKQLAHGAELHLQQVINIRSYRYSDPHREILVFGLHYVKTMFANFIIYDAPKLYSEQYKTVLKDFFTIFS